MEVQTFQERAGRARGMRGEIAPRFEETAGPQELRVKGQPDTSAFNSFSLPGDCFRLLFA